MAVNADGSDVLQLVAKAVSEARRTWCGMHRIKVVL
jgi:hypothetical protein|tara:strand:+ start:851 stop:958 length:108 start_codon:yes stop_codon:yes gene_type:complete